MSSRSVPHNLVVGTQRLISPLTPTQLSGSNSTTSRMTSLRSRFPSLPPLDPVLVHYLGPAIAALFLSIAGYRYITSLVRAVKGPTWHPGDNDLSKAGTSTEATGPGVSAGDKTFDVVIIGGGCCGCVLASRSESNMS